MGDPLDLFLAAANVCAVQTRWAVLIEGVRPYGNRETE